MRIYVIILVLTMIIQIVSRYIYLKYKKINAKCNYSGGDISNFILRKYKHFDVSVDVLTYKTNYEQYDFEKQIIQLKQSVYYGTSITSLAMSAQRTYLYLIEEKNLLGKLKVLLTPFVYVTIGLSWFCIAIGLITSYYSLVYLGISMLVIVLIHNLITMFIEIQASRLALKFLTEEIVDDDEIKLIQIVLTNNIFFYVTNYSQTIFDIIYYASKNLINILRKKK